MIDIRSHFVEILGFDSGSESNSGASSKPSEKPRQAGLRHTMHFRVFEEKRFSSTRPTGSIEPREALIADVTNDGRADLILLAHDRVLVYPQDEAN